MSDDRAYPVLLGLAIRHQADNTADQARTAGSCGHPGARFCSALAPEAGTWCVACGAAPLGDLLTMPWCCMCDGDAFARPGITAARSDRLEVLFRACEHCLTRDTDESSSP